MNTAERIFQAIFFEVSMLAIVVPISVLLAGFAAEKMVIVGIALSMIAMLWNYIYNIVFDKLAGDNRIERSLVVRIIHSCGFEFGMVAITLPVIAWYLNISWFEAIILEAGFLTFILVYTFIFNWLYDRYQPYKKWFGKGQLI
ncbi:PACE efflux transporter [Colwellia sp. M166]|uniref:PACE efflux transporter n=1 Tax=Colwellia sp. M166 TaxID=2583805 RepID=UPI00211E63C3|nr:PACE efflux transporter [Colwellia sp. M166]UUO24281.1 PACE efflux transporter [Colwellia sp. M166]|tara:strand:- start:46459 stop:46887 length:429 start_codon:yes stop_codon:yes gene_type:complete